MTGVTMALEWVLYDLHFQLWQNVASSSWSHAHTLVTWQPAPTYDSLQHLQPYDCYLQWNEFIWNIGFNYTIPLTTMICLITAMKNVKKMSPFTWVP